MEDGIQIIPISDLLQRRRPISGTISLLHSYSPPTPSPPFDNSKTLIPNPNSHTKILKPLTKPSIIIGILTLPIINYSNESCPHLCLLFSDDHASLCCDVLEFDIRMVRRKIRVIAWNFIPFKKKSGGLLEIVKWEFVESSIFCNADSFYLSFKDDGFKEGSDNKGKYNVFGLLISVSPVSSVPCSNESGSRDLCCFMAEFFPIDCKSCDFNDCGKNPKNSVLERDANGFSGSRYVYFCGILSSWYPVLVKLVGSVVSLGGLRKKLVYIGKEEARLMFVSTEKSCLRVPKLRCDDDFMDCNGKAKKKGKGELGKYIGVVRGIYVQGMVVHLDEEVWLLLTNESQLLPHSVRIGSVVYVRNVHIVNPKFPWGKMLILGACCKTNISTILFSPLEIGSQSVSRSQSLLGKFMESLVIPARLWVLLSVQCMKNKFSTAFSEKEIFGTKHNEGLVQTYARFILPSSVFQSQHGVFKEFCDHDSCGSGSNICYGSLCLICRATGRLQYIDATASIDAVVPDIPSSWNMNAIYEVFNYSLVLEGKPETWGEFRVLDGEFFSCGSLFETITIERQRELTVYVHFSWSNVCCRHFTNHALSINSSAKLDPGTFHLLCVAHKFPLQPQFHGDLLISGKSRLFAEVMVLPWDLNISFSDGAVLTSKLPQDERDEDYQNGFASKRCKTHQTSSCIDKVGLCSSFEESGKRLCDQPTISLSLPHKTRSFNNTSGASPVQVPCTVTGGEIHGQSMDVSALLCFNGNRDMLCSKSTRKVLLEFSSENFYKYKLLQIGDSYIMKHCAEKCFCDFHNFNLGSSLSITLETNFWSLSCHFSEAMDCLSSPYGDPSSASCSIIDNLSGFHLQNELVLNPCSSAGGGSFSDVKLYVAADATALLDVYMGFQALKKPVINLSLGLSDIYSKQVGYQNTVVALFENQGMYSRNGLPEGNLISLQGTVVSIGNSGSFSIDTFPCNGASLNTDLPRFNKEKEGLLYLLVLTDGLLVQIGGCLSKLDSPVGLGPGAVVTFHRILVSSTQTCLMLTPVSFITVNSVGEEPSPTVKSLCSIPEETVASCVISDLIISDMCQPRRFCCRIVSIHFLMLERNRNLDKLSQIHSSTPAVNIPLAGFILDDGSSLCCCWTNGDSAATFLRLHEEIPQAGRASSWRRWKAAVRGRGFSTPSYQLDRILKKHGRVSVKNYGSRHETSCQDLHLSVGPDYTIDSQDENLLKFLMFNACSSTFWNVIGHVMNFDAVTMLEKNLVEEQMYVHGLQNVWAREVCQVNPLAQAKALFQDL
ncbi:CST complex subunit CTC1 isoform X2 [Beta vulgaris subsp. vulgaris]|uniref:CST complex subunit CTC1 isoform X2 n=1 Tax=Beta vulgaris subsp. vulgaris TaxID=3555 RepID=UPI0020366C4A|nr:CST complex subunit CTC1 isoform X2 [Beta vulgaris subsp. vulgaris]